MVYGGNMNLDDVLDIPGPAQDPQEHACREIALRWGSGEKVSDSDLNELVTYLEFELQDRTYCGTQPLF